ncbi:hypothetical protein KAJ38_02760 [Candidatus Pacearchaeota archaeon]|nr:hypothetical protein [Candidatus Pacearchaeota archaeon]
MKKEIGYVISVAGIAVMALGFGIIDLKLEFLEGVAGNYIAGAGIVAVIVGVVISLKAEGGRKSKQVAEEVPIYEGVGKKRKIVGYRKD